MLRKVTVPPEPTDALPGSPRKISIMRRRAREGFSVFHPGDARLPESFSWPDDWDDDLNDDMSDTDLRDNYRRFMEAVDHATRRS